MKLPDPAAESINMARLLRGVIEHSIDMEEDALGTTYEARVGESTVSLTTPRPALADQRDLRPPVDEEDSSFDRYPTWGWGSVVKTDVAGRKQSIRHAVAAIMVEVSADVDTEQEIEEFVVKLHDDHLGAWWDLAVSWLELWTDQWLTDEDLPGVPPGIYFWAIGEDPEPRVYGRGGGAVHIRSTSGTRLVSRRTLQAAFDLATAGKPPPVQWELYLRSGRRHDRRLAIIDAATAVEVALSEAVRARLPNASDDTCEAIIGNANGIGGLIRLIHAMYQPPDKDEIYRVQGKIAEPRNHAVHRGHAPDDEKLRRARNEARKVLDNYSPLRGP